MNSSDARIETVVGNGTAGCAAEGASGVRAAIAEPFGVAVGPDGALYFCDLGNHRICRVDVGGRIATAVGSGADGGDGDGGPAFEAALREPYEIRFDTAGNLLFVDMQSHVVRRVARETGFIETIAGTGEAGCSGDGGPAKDAAFRQPHSIEIDADGAIYIADIGNHRVRRVDPTSGVVDTYAGTGEPAPTVDGANIAQTPLFGPRTLAFDESGDLFLALREGNAVYRIDAKSQTIHHVAGTGKGGYRGDGGPALEADLAGPKGITVDCRAIYIADTESHTIRRIDRRSGLIRTVVGNGERFDGEDGEPLHCGLARPHGVFVAGDALYIGDTDNHRIRVLRGL